MRRFALSIAIIGLGILLGFLLKTPREISSLEGLIPGTVVSIHGEVSEERKFGSGKIMFVNEVPIFCECSKSYINKSISVTGVVERFPEDLRLKAMSIDVLP